MGQHEHECKVAVRVRKRVRILSGPSSTIINAALKCVCYVQTPGRDICKYFVLMVMIVLTVMIMEKNK